MIKNIIINLIGGSYEQKEDYFFFGFCICFAFWIKY